MFLLDPLAISVNFETKKHRYPHLRCWYCSCKAPWKPESLGVAFADIAVDEWWSNFLYDLEASIRSCDEAPLQQLFNPSPIFIVLCHEVPMRVCWCPIWFTVPRLYKGRDDTPFKSSSKWCRIFWSFSVCFNPSHTLTRRFWKVTYPISSPFLGPCTFGRPFSEKLTSRVTPDL